MELGKKIKFLRQKGGLTQEKLAEKLGIAPQSVSKWENGVAMPDITLLPLLAEIFGVSIDELFDLTAAQRLNRIENRMEIEEELPQEVFKDYEEFLKNQLSSEQYKKRATGLLAALYHHRMNSYAVKVSRYARQAITLAPNEKNCQFLLGMAEGHAVWDWNISNHSKAVEFYKELAEQNPDLRLPYCYLLDNLIADRRADEAEKYLEAFSALPDSNPVITADYCAHIALARFDVKTADGIIENLLKEYPDDSICLFEAAQYYAAKCDYPRAIDNYERSFECEKRYPRYMDALQAITQIYEITGDYVQAAAVCDRVIDLLKNEWGMTEETALKEAYSEKERLLAKAR